MVKKKPEPVPDPTPEELERVRLMEMPLIERNRLMTEKQAVEGVPLHALVREDYQRMNVPEGLRGMSLEEVSPSVRTHIETYEANFGRCETAGCGLYLFGKPGRGKTGAAVAVLKFARAHFRTGFFTTVTAFREAVRHLYEYEPDVLVTDHVRQVDMLVLDSLALSDLNPFFTMDHVRDLVRDRGTAGKPTFITTTLSEREMTSLAPDFFGSVGKYFQTVEVTGVNRGDAQRDELGKLFGKNVKGG